MSRFLRFALTLPWLLPGTLRTAARCQGVAIHPGAEIQAVIAAHPAGTAYCLDPGLYRITQTIEPKDGDNLAGSPGTILNGSKLVANWSRKGNLWFATGQTQHSRALWKSTWPALAHPEAQVNEDLFIDGRQLKPVLKAADVAAGRFYFDYAAATIYIADDPAGHIIESSAVESAIRSRGQRVTVQGLTIEKFTVSGISLGHHSVIRDNEVRYVHGAGIGFGDGARVLNNRTHHNGMYGMEGSGEGPLVEGNEIAFNDTAGYYTVHGGCWAAGGSKFVRSNHLVVRRNYVHDNYCSGLWTDIDNIDTTYEDNRVENNYAQGIFVEIGFAGIIRNNTITGNMGTGIMFNSSSDQDVYGNKIAGNGVGTPANGAAVHPTNRGDIVIIQQNRGSGTHGMRLSKNIFVHDNTITIAGGVTGATRQQGDPSVFKQNIRFQNNHYYAPDLSGSWWVWSNGPCTWREWRSFGQDTAGTAQAISASERKK